MKDNNFDTYPEVAYHNSFVITNQQLHVNDEIDDTMSGTTGITTLLRGRHLYTANVGDSRALIAERQGTELVAVDLSSDQTPFRCARLAVLVGFGRGRERRRGGGGGRDDKGYSEDRGNSEEEEEGGGGGGCE